MADNDKNAAFYHLMLGSTEMSYILVTYILKQTCTLKSRIIGEVGIIGGLDIVIIINKIEGLE